MDGSYFQEKQSNFSHLKFIDVDENLYRQASSIIKSVFIPENAEGVNMSFKLSITPRNEWATLCKTTDEKFGTQFSPQFEKLSNLKYFVMYDGEKPVGISGIYTLKGEENEAWVGWLGVAEDAQGHGYGKKVLQHVEDLAREQGCNILRLWSEADETFKTAHGMYERAGFQHERSVIGTPLADKHYKTTYDVYSIRLDNPTIPADRWPLSSLKKFGLAGGISPGQIVDDGEASCMRPSMEIKNKFTKGFNPTIEI